MGKGSGWRGKGQNPQTSKASKEKTQEQADRKRRDNARKKALPSAAGRQESRWRISADLAAAQAGATNMKQDAPP